MLAMLRSRYNNKIMLENFINQHRKLSMVLSIVLVIGLFIWLVVTSFSSQPNSNTGVSLDGNGESNSSLPYQNYLYSITKPNSNTIIIKAYSGYRTPAVNYLVGVGIDPTDYKINFMDYTNPFDSYE